MTYPDVIAIHTTERLFLPSVFKKIDWNIEIPNSAQPSTCLAEIMLGCVNS